MCLYLNVQGSHLNIGDRHTISNVYIQIFKTPQHTEKVSVRRWPKDSCTQGSCIKSAWCIRISMAESSQKNRLQPYDCAHILWACVYAHERHFGTCYWLKRQRVCRFLTLCRGAAMGSEKAKKGRAKFMKPFLNDSSFLCPWMILMSSRHTRPTTAEVVVAIAGMILPAISLLWARK